MNVAQILQLVSTLVPVASNLVATLKQIREATEKDHPEIWAKVRDDWKDAVKDWQDVVG